MKKLLFLLTVVALLSTACTSEPIILTEEASSEINYTTSAKNSKTSNDSDWSFDVPCVQIPLMAGQYHNAGSVNIYVVDGEIVIAYESTGDWEISGVHMDISACDNLTFPVTGSGNPKIGKFQYKSEHPEGTDQVAFYFNENDLEDQFCVALHAVVNDGNGNEETAWGQGIDFGGNSWAMYASVDLSDCVVDPIIHEVE
ncbi:hypothetical protein Q2T40_17660 [Winogradskyella maritima]|uniref:Uncharacterized protein n=1 Tax=Winogradskyella maritima TaxID=1517766 RepID=A0ABV8AED1_9FLAO|nr:hypothetical protein [Winogradskyella maritima]